jgi:hypothetical protein
MKYLEQYIEEKLRIKILGELTTNECAEGDGLGVSLVIDGYEIGLEVWYADYTTWLENKYDELLSTDKKIKLTFEDFKLEVLSAMDNKPEHLRKGQFVFNHIEQKYGVGKSVQKIDGVDCFYDDKMIDEFIERSYMYLIGMDNTVNLLYKTM